MPHRSKEYIPNTAETMHSTPREVIAYIETGVNELELDLFEAIAAAIVCYGEQKLAAHNSIQPECVIRNKKILEDKTATKDRKLRIALTVLPWFGIAVHLKGMMAALIPSQETS